MANNFTKRVFELVREIPRGKVSTYGEIAMAAGKPRGARVVGFTLHRNDDPEHTPCHRVVFKDGSLASGYVFGGADVQREILEKEGVVFTKNGKVDMKICNYLHGNF
ncbi:MAG: MGMT family protein [Oscillospiraceae bacterium]|jgi:methylated-DNA-protein-cysteine methyltransferase-like protein|nr:MGMT family protein [Oscillospiraceae bacterium]